MSSNTKPPITLDDYVEMGNAIKAVDALLDSILHRPKVKSSRLARQARRAREALVQVRGMLDTEVCDLVPREKDPRNYAVKVFYGGPLVRRVTRDPRDQFDRWVQAEPDLREVTTPLSTSALLKGGRS